MKLILPVALLFSIVMPSVLLLRPSSTPAQSLWDKVVNRVLGDPFFRQPEVQDLLLGDTLEKQRKIFQEGYRLYQAGELDKARGFFIRANEVYTQLQDYHLFFLGKIESQSKNFGEALDYFSQLQTLHPQSVWIHEANLETGKVAFAQKKFDKAASLLEPLQERKNDVGQEAMLYLGRCYLAGGEAPRALALYKKLRAQSLPAHLRREVREDYQKLRAGFPSLFPEGAELEEAGFLLKERDYQKAGALLRDLLDRLPPGDQAVEVLMTLARSHQLQRQREEEISVLQRALSDPSGSAQAHRILYRLAQIHWNLDDNREALRLLSEWKQRFPADPLQPDALYMVGRIYQDQKDYERAIQHYRDLKDRFPQNRFHDEAWWRIGWLRYSQGRHRDAQKEFSKALSSGVQPSWRGEFLYWLGRSLENNGKTEEAKGVYLRLRQGGTETYYSVLADERLKKLKVTLPDPGFPPSSGTLGSDPQSFPEEVLFHLQRSRELSEVRAPQLAAQELDAIRSHLPLNPELALVVLAEYGKNRLPHKGISLALHLMQRENSKEILPSLERYAYPLGFYDLIRAVASDRNLDPYLVAALIRQESLFDPMATSPANAQGLMQILPSTGLRYMTSEQQGDPRKRGFYEPSTNIQIGVAYLQGLLQRYGGDLTRVLAAYNAGEKAVAKWETDFPNAPPEVFAENITYSETRLYVKLVLRNYAIYKRIYGRASR